MIDEDDEPKEIVKSVALETGIDIPTIDPGELVGKTILAEYEVNGSVQRGKVIEHLKDRNKVARQLEDEIVKRDSRFLAQFGEEGRKEIYTYDALMNQIAEHGDGIGGDGNDACQIYAFDNIVNHQKKGQGWEVQVEWASGELTWEPLVFLLKSDPISVTKYAQKKDLLDRPGWKRCKPYVGANQTNITMMIQTNATRKERKIAFGVDIPYVTPDVKYLDNWNSNMKWGDSDSSEMTVIV